MEAEILLSRLCARHGVDPSRGARLLPLVRWALQGPLESRKTILQVVEASLVRDEEPGPERAKELEDSANRAILVAVARVLHSWSPVERLLNLGPGWERGGEGPLEDEGA
jgi:hypothetical protein